MIISHFCHCTSILLHREQPSENSGMLSNWTTPVKIPKSFKWAGFVSPFTLTVSHFPQDTLSLSYLSHMNCTAATQANQSLVYSILLCLYSLTVLLVLLFLNWSWRESIWSKQLNEYGAFILIMNYLCRNSQEQKPLLLKNYHENSLDRTCFGWQSVWVHADI